MPILGVPVSLGEVLENSSPLREADIWGVLCQGAEAIQDLFFRGEAIQDGVANFVITLDTLLLSPNGRAQFSESSQTKNVSNFIAPEIHTGILMSEAAIEKIYVYSLGKTLQVAIDYSLKKDPSLTISRNLETILNAMCERNPSLRIALIHVLEACSLQSQRRTVTRTPSFSQSVARLAKTVTGTQADLSYWSYDSYNYNYNYNNNSGSSSDQSRQSTLNRRSLKSRRASRRNRRRNGSGRSHKEKDRSRSRSPARSSSRSRSRSSYSNAGNVENVDPREDKTTDTSSTSSQSTVRTTHTTASPKRRPSTNSRPSSLHIPSNGSMTTTIPMPTMSSSASQARSDTSQYSYGSSCSSRHRRSPSSLFGAKVDVANHLANNPAYDRYLRLKDRQRKLQALQKNPSDEIGFWGSDNSDGYSDTRSVTSGISVMQGSFLPDLSSEYGPDMALKLGPRGSDRDSIISSEMSFFQHDPNAMRSEIDPTPMYASPSLKSMTEQALHSNTHPTRYSHVPRSPSSSILGSLADDYSTGNKEYNGPEFICRGRKPLVKLNMPLSGESLKNTANARRVIIVLLNGQKLEAMCDPSTTGKQLFQTLVSHTGLQEIQSYFGLTYMHDGEHFFLDQDTKLHKVAPDGWREGGKGQAAITFILFFRIKYYGNTVLDSNHQNLLYLQLRQDILEERLECDENRALTLAAFALQVECGDYQKEMMGRNYFVPDYYFSKRILQLYGTGFIRDHTPDAHRSICGLSQDDAMVKFIRLVQELPEYGTHFHKVYKTKNENPNSMSWIGIGAHSMIIAENLKKERVIVDRQPWNMVDKLSFKGKRVTVQIKPDPSVGGKPSKVYFYTNSHRKGRYLLQMSTDQHKFQLKLLSQSSVTSPTQNSKPFEPPMFADIAFADLDEEDEDDEMFQLSSPVSPLPTEDQNVPVQLRF